MLIACLRQVRRAIKGFIAENPEYERILPHVKGEQDDRRHFIMTETDSF